MKPIYVRHLHEALDRHVGDGLPGYSPVTLRLSKAERKQATLFAGSRLYGRLVPEGTLFIHLIPHRRQEQFLAEIGWSTTGRFPVELTSTHPLQRPDDERTANDWLIDFAEVYHRRYGRGHIGWEVWRCSVGIEHPDFVRIFTLEDMAPVSDEQARARTETAVQECLVDLRDVAVPYLDEWLAFRRAAG